MSAAALEAVDWSDVSPTERLITMPSFPMDGSIRTLGVGVADWMRRNLIQPDGPRAGSPFTPSSDQIEFLLWFYAVGDDGRWMFNLGVRRLSKGKGKSPFAAALSLAEFLGPVRLDRFDDRALGGCVGKPTAMPLVQIVAAAESQTKNTMRFVRAFCPKSGHLATEYNVDVGKTQFYRLPEGTLEVITSSFVAAEGAQATFAVGDEPEHWTPTNQGDLLNSTILDNLTKTGGRMAHTCNAWLPGGGSVAEDTWDDWVAQEEGRLRGEQRILYDARVAPPDTDMSDRDSLMAALEHCYAGSDWIDLENVVQRIWRKSAKLDESKRKYLNWPTAPADAWITDQEWSACSRPDQVVGDRERIVAFFDGSKSQDATAIVGCRVSDGHLFLIDAWERPLGPAGEDWTVPVEQVDASVDWMFDRWDVAAFYADVREWESFVHISWPQRHADKVELWAQPSGKNASAIAWDMRSHVPEFTHAAEAMRTEVVEQQVTHDGSALLHRHVVNARSRPNRWGESIGKESPDSPNKIDAAVCAVGARMVRRHVLANPTPQNVKQPGRVIAWG